MQNIKEAARRLSGQLTEWRRALHQIPESGLICPQTAAYICARLEEMGISWQSYERHSGIVAVIGKGPGPVIGLRADMDGLDVQEENALAYASKNGRMHACGHDAHTAMLLGTAQLLKEREDQLRGRVKLIFQPDEEGLNGAKLMVEDGVLDDPKVDLMYAMHVGSILGQGAHPGQLFWKQGAVFASSDNFRITVRGQGGHASTPFLAKNPIQAAAQIIENFGSLVARSVNYNVPTVLTITGITGGNGAHNIIPEEVTIVGGVRTQDAAVREDLMRRMREIAVRCAEDFGTEAELIFLSGCPPTVNDPEVTERFIRSAKKILPPEDVVRFEQSSMGGEDVSYFFSRVPGCYTCLYNLCPSDDGKEYPHHNGRFCIDDSVLYLGTAVMTQAVLDELAGSREG